ncbi:MAG: hypothetical protein HY904_25020 [Deltaproteobacteria bacterium]|nr:hypothetical protein [Deltaproteobacteria bacterium]
MRDRTALALAAAALVLRVAVPADGAEWALLGATVGVAAVLALLGAGLLRVLGFQGAAHAFWPASVVTGFAAAIALTSAPLAFGLAQRAQGMALLTGLLALGVAALLAPGGSTSWREAALAGGAPAVALLSAWFPLGMGGAWSVAGHDLDTLQHQDGALHAVMALLATEGTRTAPGYPLGLHALASGLGWLMDLTVFQSFAVLMILVVVVLACAAAWLTAAGGLPPLLCALAGALAAAHPLVLFASFEQFGPQVAAAALVPGVLAACAHDVRANDPRARAVLPALLLAAVLGAYGLALVVAGPLALLALGARRGVLEAVKRLAWVALFAACLAPLGMVRLAERLGGKGEAQNPVKATRRTHDSKAPVAQNLLAPSVDAPSVAREATHVLRWELTAAHVLGTTPYRDNFARTTRLVAVLAGRSTAGWVSGPLWAWAALLVPLLTMILLMLAAGGLFTSLRAWPGHLSAGWFWALPSLGAAVWLGAGGGIKPYYGFKIGSLCAGLVLPAAVVGMHRLAERTGPRAARVLFWLVVAGRLPALLAVEAEYGRALALDASFTRLVQPALTASWHRPAFADDTSPTRQFWESRLLFARAREQDAAEDAEVVLCGRGRDCVVEGRVVARAGPYVLWDRR